MPMPIKQRRTAKELEVMIKARSHISGIIIVVSPDSVYGWHAKIISPPAEAIGAVQIVNGIAAELRLLYDLGF
jgi:hypothetical protein